MKNRRHIFITFLLLIATLGSFTGCNAKKKEPVRIALSKASPNYVNWLKKGDTALVIINMYTLPLDSALAELDRCAGLVVTGGEDVQPEFYGKGSEKRLCTEIDPARDTLEMALIKRALALKMPVLGICRGEQIINVALGGSLIVDIPTHFIDLPRINHVVHQCANYLKCAHPVKVFPGTFLHSLTGCDKESVTTNHHQAVDQLAPGLVSNARSDDGLTEGIEWETPEGKSFLIGVQWHPERMDTSSCLSGKLLQAFISRTLLYNNN